MTDRTITVCPECDAARIHRNTPQKPVGRAAARWHCSVCGADFAEPHERPAESASGPSGLAGELLAADPEAVSADD